MVIIAPREKYWAVRKNTSLQTQRYSHCPLSHRVSVNLMKAIIKGKCIPWKSVFRERLTVCMRCLSSTTAKPTVGGLRPRAGANSGEWSWRAATILYWLEEVSLGRGKADSSQVSIFRLDLEVEEVAFFYGGYIVNEANNLVWFLCNARKRTLV